MSNWQPIETVPKDERLVLFYMPGGMAIGPAIDGIPLTPKETAAFIQAGGAWPDYQAWTPTHWMELPAPPLTEEPAI